MPHVVLEGEASPATLAEEVEHVFEREEDRIAKTESLWTGLDEDALLFEALAVEGGPPTPFLLRVDGRDDGMVVRLHDLSDGIEKTDGVKRTLALVAHALQEVEPGLTVGKTNLDAYLD
jgi:hypothetical protein